MTQMNPIVAHLFSSSSNPNTSLTLRHLINLDVNATNVDGWSALHYAAKNGNCQLVKFILTHPDVQLTFDKAVFCATPLMVACFHYDNECVQLLLNDPRIDPNVIVHGRGSALYRAVKNLNERMIDIFLMHARNLQFSDKFVAYDQNGKKDVAGTLINHLDNMFTYFSDRERMDKMAHPEPLPVLSPYFMAEEARANCQLSSQKCRRIRTLLLEFKANSGLVRHRLRLENEYPDAYAHHLYALIIFLCDGLLKIKTEGHSEQDGGDTLRFYCIAERLPIELQMALCNRVQETMKDEDPEHNGKPLGNNIKLKDSEPAFQHLAQLYQFTLSPSPAEQ